MGGSGALRRAAGPKASWLPLQAPPSLSLPLTGRTDEHAPCTFEPIIAPRRAGAPKVSRVHLVLTVAPRNAAGSKGILA